MIALIDISSNTMKKLRRDKMLPSPSWIESKETFQVDDGDITERIRQEIFRKEGLKWMTRNPSYL